MRVTIVSAKCTPGHVSHLMAYYCLFEEMGHHVILLLDCQYRNFIDEAEYNICYLDNQYEPMISDIILVYNMSLNDIRIIRNIQKKHMCKVLFVYHEPWYELKKWISDIFTNRIKTKVLIKNIGVHFFAKRMLKKADIVLLPSTTAKEVYCRKDVKYNRNWCIFPLIYKDEISDKDTLDREYLSFIATADKEKNFPLFIELISKYLPLDREMKVQIITRTNIKEFWNSGLDKYVEEKRLVVKSGSNLSNEEINQALKESCCTWLYYYHSTQSGVLARAFMCGSPVLASKSGCFPEYIDGTNGMICGSDDLKSLYDAYTLIKQNRFQMSQNARKRFENFLYTYHLEEMKSIIKML